MTRWDQVRILLFSMVAQTIGRMQEVDPDNDTTWKDVNSSLMLTL